MTKITNLPAPDQALLPQSEALVAKLRSRIRGSATGIGFDEYMRVALYEPGLGYYVSGAAVFGRAGDFVTAPEMSGLFGACIARQCADVLSDVGGVILEYGGGTARLAASVLSELERLGVLPERYYILELSPELRQRQREHLRAAVPAIGDRVTWLSAPPRPPIRGVMLANEILDALPVKVFKLGGDVMFERRVGLADGGFVWCDVPADAALEAALARVLEGDRVERVAGYASEINLLLGPWIADLAETLEAGVALLVDYGYPRREYYHPDRAQGTLLCHYRHRVHDDPFLYPGLQDLTAAVDFTAVAEAADRAGLDVLGFTSQASFLLSCGLAEVMAREGASSDAAQIRIAQEAKILTLPTEMGEYCKVMAVGTGMRGPLLGFKLRDERHRL